MMLRWGPGRPDVSALAAYAGVVLAAVASIIIVPGLHGLMGAGLAILMLSIAIVDARRFIIPDWLVAIAIALGFVGAGVESGFDVSEVAYAALRGALVGLAFGALREAYWRLRKREGMGLGDVKLAVVAGLWLDWMGVAFAVEMAALAALAITGFRLWRGQAITGATAVPFGLYFAPAIWLAWLIEAGLLNLIYWP